MENVANLLSDRMRSLMDYIMQEIADGLRVSSIEASPALFILGLIFIWLILQEFLKRGWTLRWTCVTGKMVGVHAGLPSLGTFLKLVTSCNFEIHQVSRDRVFLLAVKKGCSFLEECGVQCNLFFFFFHLLPVSHV